MKGSINKKLKNSFYDLRRATAYSAPQTLLKELRASGSKVKLATVQKWLSGQPTYYQHKPINRKFQRRKYEMSHPGDLLQIDLLDVRNMNKHNKPFKYILTCIDGFSKKAFATPLKSKNSDEVEKAFSEMLFTIPNVRNVSSDKGKEFAKLPALLKKSGINYYTSQDDMIKCGMIERFQRTLRSRFNKHFTKTGQRRFIEALPKIMKNYNKTVHSTTGFKPDDVTDENNHKIFAKLYPEKLAVNEPGKSKFKPGDQVLLARPRKLFKKEGHGWTLEPFFIHKIRETSPVTYEVRDQEGDVIEGGFYKQELQQIH
jgi:hypothetical protein